MLSEYRQEYMPNYDKLSYRRPLETRRSRYKISVMKVTKKCLTTLAIDGMNTLWPGYYIDIYLDYWFRNIDKRQKLQISHYLTTANIFKEVRERESTKFLLDFCDIIPRLSNESKGDGYTVW